MPNSGANLGEWLKTNVGVTLTMLTIIVGIAMAWADLRSTQSYNYVALDARIAGNEKASKEWQDKHLLEHTDRARLSSERFGALESKAASYDTSNYRLTRVEQMVESTVKLMDSKFDAMAKRVEATSDTTNRLSERLGKIETLLEQLVQYSAPPGSRPNVRGRLN